MKIRGIISAAVLAATVTTGIFSTVALADYDYLRIEEVEYKGNGVVKVDFDDDVRYSNNFKLIVKSGGRTYGTTIYVKSDDDLKFKIKNYSAGKKYSITVKGVADEDSYAPQYKTLKSSIKIPGGSSGSGMATKAKIQEVEYDYDDCEISVDFVGNVSWSGNPKVVVKTAGGKKVKSRLYGRDNDDCEVYANLTPGKKYKVIIKGVRQGYSGKYGKAVKTFYAYDD